MIEPLRLSLEVACSAEHAFETWTRRTSMWWPVGHSVTVEDGLDVIFEPWVGGRIFERTPSGREEDWGEVLSWDPPRGLRYLWHLRADREDATEVHIAFLDAGAGTARVEIEHRGWERLGDRGATRREANQRGWGGLLPHFAEACLSAPSDAATARQKSSPRAGRRPATEG